MSGNNSNKRNPDWLHPWQCQQHKKILLSIRGKSSNSFKYFFHGFFKEIVIPVLLNSLLYCSIFCYNFIWFCLVIYNLYLIQFLPKWSLNGLKGLMTQLQKKTWLSLIYFTELNLNYFPLLHGLLFPMNDFSLTTDFFILLRNSLLYNSPYFIFNFDLSVKPRRTKNPVNDIPRNEK